MEDYKLGAIESRFADIIWDNEPMTTKELVDACAEELNWKRPTTYSILKKLSEKGFFKMEDRMVVSLISRQNTMPVRVKNSCRRPSPVLCLHWCFLLAPGKSCPRMKSTSCRKSSTA